MNHNAKSIFVFILVIFSTSPVYAWCIFNCVPIDVSFYDDKSGNGLTARFHNNSEKHLAVKVLIENKTLNQSRRGYLEFSPNETLEVGWNNSTWKFMSGETIDISHEDYNAIIIKVP